MKSEVLELITGLMFAILVILIGSGLTYMGWHIATNTDKDPQGHVFFGILVIWLGLTVCVGGAYLAKCCIEDYIDY